MLWVTIFFSFGCFNFINLNTIEYDFGGREQEVEGTSRATISGDGAGKIENFKF